MYLRALDADPNDATILGGYALFLHTVRHDPVQAEAMYQRALTADPTHAIRHGNYAQVLFVLGRDADGERHALRVLELATDSEVPLQAECNFYLFMHVAHRQQEAGRELKRLLERGVSTGTWSFADNLTRLAKEQDPRTDFLTAVAEALATGDDTNLRHFEQWQAIDTA